MLDVLSGVTVLDLTSNVAGPYCTLILADLGAEVWKIEPPGTGDVVRRWPPFAPDGTSTAFLALNRGKRSLELDLKSSQGRQALVALAEHGDVLVSSLRPGAMARLGLDDGQLARLNPRLIVADISAFGGLGNRGQQPGFDAVMQAYTGLMELTGYPDQPPARVGTGVIDFSTGMWTALGIIGSLLHRDRTGAARQVSATLFGTAVGLLMHHLAAVDCAQVTPSRIGTAQHNSAPYEAITAADGMVMVGVTSENLWANFCAALGIDELRAHPDFATNDRRVANRSRLRAAVENRTTVLNCAEVVERLESAGVPCSEIRTVADLAHDPQLADSGLWQRTSHGGFTPAIPLRMGHAFAEHGLSAPQLGADTVEVLRQIGHAPPTPADDGRRAPHDGASEQDTTESDVTK